MPSLPTVTATFLFTDIEGSTRLWEQSPDAMRLALARQDALLRGAVDDNDGVVFKTVGDAFCAVFADAPEAVRAALAAQSALNSATWETPTPLRARMAVHTGSAEVRDGDYFGQTLSRVARLLAAGHGGQTLLSLAAQERARDALPIGASLRNLGQHRLKDLSQPEQVFQLLYPPLPADFPPLRSLNSPDLPNNLPQQVTSFVGRENEVGKVKALLDKTRLLTLTGPGGSGKTRLSLQAAADLLDKFPDGAWLAELAPLANPALVAQTVADALGVREEADRPLARTLADWLKPKRLLLILDNCEHVLSASASLAADLLRHCPNVRILASSREPLNTAGEAVFRVPPLSLPDPKQAQTAESLSECEAVRLFIERARLVQPEFAVTDVNAPAVAQICCRLDGIPLAIELAAARVRSLSVGEVNARLDQRFRLLTGGSRTVLPRQQTLRALIDWSYDLLTEPEKTVFERLSVFAGGWSLEAAEAVCTGGVIEDWEALDLLTSLADKSLVVVETAAANMRYRLLETVRQYAEERLRESDDQNSARDRHRDHFLNFALEIKPTLEGPEQAAQMDRLEAEHDNLRAALAWCEGQLDSADAGLRLAAALWRFWFVRGYLSEGRQWLERVLAHDAGSPPSAARATALNIAGNLAQVQGDYAAARAHYEQALALHRQMGNAAGIASTCNNLGNLVSEQGDSAAAQALYEESLTLFRQEGYRQGIADATSNLGLLAFERGDLAAARPLLEESLALERQGGNAGGVATSLGNLGLLAESRGDLASARASYEECLSLYRELGHQLGIGDALLHLGNVLVQQGEFTEAQSVFAESLTLERRLGNLPMATPVLEGLAAVAQGQGQSRRSASLRGAAQAMQEAVRLPDAAGVKPEQDERLAALRAALGEAAFTAAWQSGRAMTLDEAVDYALAQE